MFWDEHLNDEMVKNKILNFILKKNYYSLINYYYRPVITPKIGEMSDIGMKNVIQF